MYFRASVKAYTTIEKSKKYDFGRRPSSPETNSMAGRICVRMISSPPAPLRAIVKASARKWSFPLLIVREAWFSAAWAAGKHL